MRILVIAAGLMLALSASAQIPTKYNYFHNDGDFDFEVTADSVTVLITKAPTPLEKCAGLTVVYVFDIYQYDAAESWTTHAVTNQQSVTIPRVGAKVTASVKYFAYGCGWGAPCGLTPWHGIGAKKWN